MTILSDTQLARMRRDLSAKLLPGTAIIQQMSVINDGAGGYSQVWTAVAGGTVACRLDPMASRGNSLNYTFLREALVSDYVATLPYDAPLAHKSRLVIGGATYEVKGMSDDHSWNVCKRALVAKVE